MNKISNKIKNKLNFVYLFNTLSSIHFISGYFFKAGYFKNKGSFSSIFLLYLYTRYNIAASFKIFKKEKKINRQRIKTLLNICMISSLS